MQRTRIGPMVLLITGAGLGCMTHRTFADRVATPEWPEFTERVKAYTALSGRLEKELPPLGDQATAQQIVSHKQSLEKAIRKARSGAQQGDIFSAPLRERFVKVVRSEIRGQTGAPVKKTIREDNPNPGATPVPLAVNAVYPDAPPLSTVPPTLLLRLPTLPRMLEYRFVGKALVLRDVRANIIVDFIPNALM
jgi:hypothetical protein